MKIFLYCLVLCTAIVLGAEQAEPSVYLYPELIENGKNLLPAINEKNSWGTMVFSDENRVLGKKKGTPFDADGDALFVRSNTTIPCYWRSRCRLQPGRSYLFGGWVRNLGARILFWFHGKYGNDKIFNRRIYYLKGINQFILPYLSEATRKKLDCDPNGWELCYSIIKSPEMALTANFAVGSYAGTGYFEVALPFVIDVTEPGNKIGFVLHIIKSKPVKKVTVFHAPVNDFFWSKEFKTPVTDFKIRVPHSDFRERYTVTVDYADGMRSNFEAPKGKYTR